MKVIHPTVTPSLLPPRKVLYSLVEAAGRTCYQSENVSDDTQEDFIRRLIKRKHFSVLEHATVSLRLICDRGVTHEIVRHRLASYSQESTRYCNYSKGKFGGEIKAIDLATGFKYDLTKLEDRQKYQEWTKAMQDAERHYLRMIEFGASPQEARSVLPQSVKTEIVVSMNIRNWRHFLEMRYVGVTGAPHPQMVEVAKQVYDILTLHYPVFFEDIKRVD